MFKQRKRGADHAAAALTREQAAALAARVREEVGEEEWRALMRLSWVEASLRFVGAVLLGVASVFLVGLVLGGLVLLLGRLAGLRLHELSHSLWQSFRLTSAILLPGAGLYGLAVVFAKAARRRLQPLAEREFDVDEAVAALPPHLGLRREDRSREG